MPRSSIPPSRFGQSFLLSNTRAVLQIIPVRTSTLHALHLPTLQSTHQESRLRALMYEHQYAQRTLLPKPQPSPAPLHKLWPPQSFHPLHLFLQHVKSITLIQISTPCKHGPPIEITITRRHCTIYLRTLHVRLPK